MNTKRKTTYTNKQGVEIPAYVLLQNATPTDTTVTVIPRVVGGTEHIITWPALGSSTKPLVQYYKDQGDLQLVPDTVYEDYWLKAGKEAFHNADTSTWLDKIKSAFDSLFGTDKKENGGNINYVQLFK